MVNIVCEACNKTIRQQFHSMEVVKGGFCQGCVMIRMAAAGVVMAALAFIISVMAMTRWL